MKVKIIITYIICIMAFWVLKGRVDVLFVKAWISIDKSNYLSIFFVKHGTSNLLSMIITSFPFILSGMFCSFLSAILGALILKAHPYRLSLVIVLGSMPESLTYFTSYSDVFSIIIKLVAINGLIFLSSLLGCWIVIKIINTRN